ncbi:MAG: radical SAM protein [Acidimicrobiia bacterium]
MADPLPETVLAETQALCPTCLRVVDATNVERDGKVYLHRTCPQHGTADTLVLSDASWWKWSRRFVRPGRRPAHVATETRYGCPYDCGFCPAHEQHACVTVFEITEACNLACPACFAGQAHVRHASLEEVEAMADALLRAEGGQADVVMLSGGEPTIHPQFFDVADAVRARPIRYVIVNSNGIRMAREPGFAEAIAERDMLVYLQFDGFSPETYQVLRGPERLYELKMRALENLSRAGVRVVLVATVVKGVNDHEVGDIVRFGAEHPAVRAVSLQPQFGEGRFVQFDTGDRMTVTDVIAAIERDSGLFTRDDFVPIPCCDPICTAATYAYVRDGAVTPVTQLVPVDAYLDYLENASMPTLSEAFRRDAEEMREVLLKLYSKSAPPGTARQAEAFFCACEPLLAEMEQMDDLPDHVFAVTIEGFMDRFVFDLSRAVRCCIQEALPDGRIVPFCVYNTLYRFAPDHRPAPPEPT